MAKNESRIKPKLKFSEIKIKQTKNRHMLALCRFFVSLS